MSGPLSPSSILREFQSHSRQQGRQQQHHQFMPTINETASQVRVMQRSNNSANAGIIGGGGSGGVLPTLAASTSAVHNQASAFGLSGSTWTPLLIGVCVLAVIAIVGGFGYYLWNWFTESKKAAAKAEQVREAIKKEKEKEKQNEDEQQQHQQQKTATEPQQLEANQLKSQLDQIKAQYLAQVQNAQQQTLASQREIQMLRQQLQHSMQQLQYQQQHTQQQQHMTKAASAPTQAPIHAQRPMRVQAPTQVQNQPTHNMQGHTQEMMGAAEDQDMSMDDDAPLPLSEDAAEPEQPEQQEQQEVEHAEPRHSEENNDFMVI